MNIDQETLRKVAHLARLQLRPDEELSMQQNLESVLSWMQQLDEIDTTGVEPLTHISERTNAFRDDTAQNNLPLRRALANAPRSDGSFFKVPKVIE